MEKSKRTHMEELNKAINETNELYESWAKKQGLSYNALMVLYTIDSTCGCSQKNICDKWLIPKQTVNTILAKYKKDGYVRFESDPKDKRGKIITLTKEGHAFADPILSKLYHIEEKTLEKMGDVLTRQMIETSEQFCNFFKQEVENE